MPTGDLSDADKFEAAEREIREAGYAAEARVLDPGEVEQINKALALVAEAVRAHRIRDRQALDVRSSVLHELSIADGITARLSGQVTGLEVVSLRRAIERGDVWLARINRKGMTRGQVIRVDTARMEAAKALTALASPKD